MKKNMVMAFLAWVLLLMCASFSLAEGNASEDDVVYRDPFTLKLRMDDEHYYRQKLDKIPYVYRNDVYLFSGEAFGIDLAIADGRVQRVNYRKKPEGADIELRFGQRMVKGKKWIMLLMIKSNLTEPVYLDGFMTLPGKQGIYETPILPLQPGVKGYESWPHPIAQLVLRNFRFKK